MPDSIVHVVAQVTVHPAQESLQQAVTRLAPMALRAPSVTPLRAV